MVSGMLVGGAGGAQVLATLDRSGHHIGFVIDTDPTSGLTSLSEVARNQGRTVWPAAMLKNPDFPQTVVDAGIDVILSVRSRSILPAALTEASRLGSYNLHHGPLPRYAGRNVVSWAIFNGESEHAVTLHRMVAEVDKGGIVAEARFPIAPDDTALSVTRKCLTNGLPLLTRLLNSIDETGSAAKSTGQNLTDFTYYSLKDQPDLRLDWRLSARRLIDLSRACDFGPFPSPWGMPETSYRGTTLKVPTVRPWEAGGMSVAEPGTVVMTDAGAAIVATGDDPVRVEAFLIDESVVGAAEIVETGSRFDCPS